MSLSSTITLNDGVTMPLFGLGTYKMGADCAADLVAYAIQQGHRLIDTAQFYEWVT